MSQIKVSKPSPEKLDSLGTDKWSSWECDPSIFDWQYASNESAYILEGKVKVTTADGEEVEITKGDLVYFPKGLKCKWNVLEKISKVYNFS